MIAALAMVVQLCATTPFSASDTLRRGFRTERLALMAQALHLNLPDSLVANAQMDSISSFMGKPIYVCTDVYGEVSHIGYQIFAPQLAEYYQNEPLFHFVERYLLELDLRLDGHNPDLRMDIDQVVLTRGSISLLRTLNPQSNFSFDFEEIRRHFYRLTWTLSNGAVVSMVVPADCQLIMGANTIEMELMAERDILRAMPLDEETVMSRWAEAKGVRENQFFILEGGDYMSRYIRGDLFFTEQDGQRSLLVSPWQPRESVSNLMLTGLSKLDLPVSLTMNRYGGKRDQLSITLSQYISFCLQEGCLLYFGIKQVKDGVLTGALFAYNGQFAYTHLLDVTFPLSLLGNGTNESAERTAEGTGEGTGEGTPASVPAVGGENIRCMAWVYIPLKLVDDKLFEQQFRRGVEKE